MKTRNYRISDLRWVRPARQERSQRTLERLLDAAEAVIGEKGFADASVGNICTRAGVSVGTFYRRFRDKHALMHALHERLAEEFRATMRVAVDPHRWEGASIAEILEAYLQFSLEVGREGVALRRAARLMVLRDSAFAERQVRLNRELRARLHAALSERRCEIGHPEPDVAIDFALEQLRSMMLTRLDGQAMADEPQPVSDDRFVEEALTSVCAYMQIPELSRRT
jgi:AcrR family transcriptional regulator